MNEDNFINLIKNININFLDLKNSLNIWEEKKEGKIKKLNIITDDIKIYEEKLFLWEKEINDLKNTKSSIEKDFQEKNKQKSELEEKYKNLYYSVN